MPLSHSVEKFHGYYRDIAMKILYFCRNVSIYSYGSISLLSSYKLNVYAAVAQGFLNTLYCELTIVFIHMIA